MTRAASVLLCLGWLAASGAAADFARVIEEYPAMRESLEHVPRKQRAWWLERHGFDASRYTTYQRPETTGLRLVGKYGRGPSVEVTAQDTLMALTMGSECALLSIANPDQPRVLNEIQLDYLPHQSLLSGSLLLTGGNGIQIWDIANPRQPVQLCEMPYAIGDFSIVDTFLYFVGNDTFFAYSFADPASPRRIGFCLDSGYVTTATRNTAVLIQPNDVLGFVDVSDPAHPQQVGTWPAWPLAAAARGNLCCAAFADPSNQFRSWFLTLDISNPASPRQIARLDSVCGFDIFLSETLAFVSGRDDAYEEFCVVNIVDSTRPRRMGACPVWNDNWAVWADLQHNRAYIASEPSGLAVVSITDLNAPHVDTCVMTADQAVDIWIDGGRAYVADYRAGMRVLDVSDPSSPRELGGVDSVHTMCETVVASDSFAFASWPQPPLFRSFLVTDPTHPMLVGGVDPAGTDPYDMELSDTIVYLVGRLRLRVINVARPREPVLVGSCVLPGDASDLCVVDTVAYASRYIVSVANPGSPVMLGSIPGSPGGAIAVRDSFAFAPAQYDSLVIVNVARPSSAFRVASLVLSGGHIWNAGAVLVGDSILYIGGDLMHVVNVANPLDPQEVATWRPPTWILGVTFNVPYVYAACYEAGVCVLETVAAGLAETPHGTVPTGCLGIAPNPTSTRVLVRWGPTEPGLRRWRLYDAAGRIRQSGKGGNDRNDLEVDLTLLETGVYFLEVQLGSSFVSAKVVRR